MPSASLTRHSAPMRCPACGEENPDRAKFCLNCATPLTAPAEPAGEVRKVVTIVFADVTGSTAIGERLDPEALRRVQARYFDTMAAVIERARRHRREVHRRRRDGRLRDPAAARGRRAARGPGRRRHAGRRSPRSTTSWSATTASRIAIRIGVNTGEVVAGDPTAGQRLVTGDTVNVAARLEQAAGPGEVLLGESTYRLVQGRGRGRARRAARAEGQVRARARVPAAVAVLADTAGHVRHLDSPMVGRTKELELFRRGLERARDERTSHLFTLLGPAGVGQVAARARVPRRRRRRDRPARPMPLLRRGHHVLRARRDRAAGGRHRGDRRRRERRSRKLTALLAGAEDGDRIARAGRRAASAGRSRRTPTTPRGASASSSSTSRRTGRSSSCSTTSTGPSRCCST